MAIFNRRYPIQAFSPTNRAGAAVVPGRLTILLSASGIANVSFTATATASSTRTAGTTAGVTFAATATASSTRTASVTASVTFTASATGIQVQQGGIAIPVDPTTLAGNAISLTQSLYRPGLW